MLELEIAADVMAVRKVSPQFSVAHLDVFPKQVTVFQLKFLSRVIKVS